MKSESCGKNSVSISVAAEMLQNTPTSRFLLASRRTTWTQRNSTTLSMRGIRPPASAKLTKSLGLSTSPSSVRSRVIAS